MSARTALIVGASRNLGLGLATEYAQSGWDVMGTVRGSYAADEGRVGQRSQTTWHPSVGQSVEAPQPLLACPQQPQRRGVSWLGSSSFGVSAAPGAQRFLCGWNRRMSEGPCRHHASPSFTHRRLTWSR